MHVTGVPAVILPQAVMFWGQRRWQEVRSGQYLDVRPPTEGKMLQVILMVTCLWSRRPWKKWVNGGVSFACAVYQRRQVLTTCGYSESKGSVIKSSETERFRQETTQTQEITKQNKQKTQKPQKPSGKTALRKQQQQGKPLQETDIKTSCCKVSKEGIAHYQ